MIENTKKISKPYYRRIESAYDHKIDLLDRDDQKIRDDLKELHKPLVHKELVEHKKKMSEIVEKRNKERIDKRVEDRHKHSQSFDIDKLNTKFTQAIIEEDQNRKEQNEAKGEEKSKIMAKKKTYSHFVKEMHIPKVSEKKKIEM